MGGPVETKVYGATTGAGAGAVLSAFILWLLGVTAWGVDAGAGHVADAIAAVPAPVSDLIGLVISIAGAFIGGYLAPHTPRPDLNSPSR